MKKILFFTNLIIITLFQQIVYSQWAQQGIDIDGEANSDVSGYSASLSNDGLTLAIGAPGNSDNGFDAGHVRVYKYINSTWIQQGLDIEGESLADNFGSSVSVSSDGLTVAIGAPGNDGNGINSGHVRVFKNIGGIWTQQGMDIDGENPNDFSGGSVSLSSDGSTVAIGAVGNNDNGSSSGHVRIFKFMNGGWLQKGNDIDGEYALDQSGISVNLSSDGLTVAIGANKNGDNGSSSGHVRVYNFFNGSWAKQGSDINGESPNDGSGTSVSLSSDGLTVAIGAKDNDGNGSNSGHVRVYKLISGAWIQQGSDIDGESTDDNFGASVCLSGDGLIVAIGAQFNDGNGSNAGHTRVYENISGTWTQKGIDIDGESAGDLSGSSVSLSSDGLTVAIGAYSNGGNGSNAGHVRIYTFGNTTKLINNTFENVAIYPNPSLNIFNIKTSLEDSKVEVSDLSGKIILTKKINKKGSINLFGKDNGVYILTIENQNTSVTKKLILQK